MVNRLGAAPAMMCAGAFLIFASHGVAQTVTGTVQGTVTDSSGGVLPGVTVAVRHVETGQERTVVTNDTGFYTAPFVPLGEYRLTATLAGFGSVVRENIQVGLNQTQVVDFRLDPRVSEAVTVTAALPAVNTTSATIKGSLRAEQILEKPTLSPGSFLTLAETFAGFQENPTSGQNNPTASSGSSINFNNTGTRGATFQINGVNNDDSSENQNRQGAALSTIEEFQVLKNSYSAEFGRGDGAVVLVQTKSGTNHIRGDAYIYRQDSDLNAKAFFSTGSPKPVNQRTEYGFTVGFPIAHDRLFAFVSGDKTNRDGNLNYARDFFLPSELAAPRLTRGNDTPANRAFIQSVLDRFPASMVANDPRSTRTFAGQIGFNQPDDDYSTRADWNLHAGDALVARWQRTHQIRRTDDVVVGEQALQNNRQQNLGISWTRVFSNRTVGEFRYGLGLRSTNVDIAAGNDTPIIRFTASPVSGSIIGNAGNFPIHRDQTDHQFVYNLAAELGRHSLKAGTDIRRQSLDDLADNFSRGFWTFNRTCGGVTYDSPYAAFLDGCVQNFQKGYGPFFLENRMNEYNGYVEDNWRLRQTVTVNLGLRYEYVKAPHEKEGRINYGFHDDRDNVEPRLGLTYSPGWEQGWLAHLTGGPGNLAIAGGYGRYDGRIFQSIFSQTGASLRFNPPNAVYRTFTTTPNILNISDPTLGFVFVPGPQASRVTLTLADPNLEMPATTKWSLSVERGMPWKSTLRVAYEGNYNDKRLKYSQDNLPVSPLNGGIVVVDHPNNAPAQGAPDLRGVRIDRIANDVLCAGTGFIPGVNPTAACPNPVPIANNEISFRVPRINERRPDPRYGTNLIISNAAKAWYEGLELEWIKRFDSGLQFQAAYTYSKSTDTTSEATFVGGGDSNQNGPDDRYAKGYSRFHTPHRFTFNGSYLLPFFAGRRDSVGAMLGGWQLAGVVKLASGTPFTVIDTSGRDLNFDGFALTRPVILDRNLIGTSVDDPARSRQQLPLSAFRSTTFGDTVDALAPRNGFFGDGAARVDCGLYKTFNMPRTGQRLMLRIEAYNVFNSVQFGFPSSDITSSTFGRIVSTADQYSARQMQVALRYTY
jgi:hypothetical protein